MSRNSSCSCSRRATPTSSNRSGSAPSCARLYSAGRSLRCARSPVAPNITSAVGRTGSRSNPAISGLSCSTSAVAAATTAALCIRLLAPFEDRLNAVGQRPDGFNRVSFQLYPLGGQPARAQRLEVARGLRRDQRPERVAGARECPRRAPGEKTSCRKRPTGGPALVQLAGRVQVARAVSERHRRARRIADRGSATPRSPHQTRQTAAHSPADRHVMRWRGVSQQRSERIVVGSRNRRQQNPTPRPAPCCPWPPARSAGRTG